jgi:hypothetical protein
MNYVIKNRYILFNTFEKFSDEFIHCYTRGYDDLGREFDFTRRTEKDDPRLFENIKILKHNKNTTHLYKRHPRYVNMHRIFGFFSNSVFGYFSNA